MVCDSMCIVGLINLNVKNLFGWWVWLIELGLSIKVG